MRKSRSKKLVRSKRSLSSAKLFRFVRCSSLVSLDRHVSRSSRVRARSVILNVAVDVTVVVDGIVVRMRRVSGLRHVRQRRRA